MQHLLETSLQLKEEIRKNGVCSSSELSPFLLREDGIWPPGPIWPANGFFYIPWTDARRPLFQISPFLVSKCTPFGEQEPQEKSLLSPQQSTATATHPELRWALPQPCHTQFNSVQRTLFPDLFTDAQYSFNKPLMGEGLCLKRNEIKNQGKRKYYDEQTAHKQLNEHQRAYVMITTGKKARVAGILVTDRELGVGFRSGEKEYLFAVFSGMR